MQPYLNFKILNKIYFNLNKRCFVFPDYTIWCFFLKCSNCLSSFRIIKELKFGHLFHVLKVYIYHLCSQRSLKFKRRSCIRPVFIFSARNSQANQGVFFSVNICREYSIEAMLHTACIFELFILCISWRILFLLWQVIM